MKNIHIISGGTTFDVRPHLSLTARAGGNAGRELAKHLAYLLPSKDYAVYLTETRMARPSSDIVTNADIQLHVDKLVADPSTKIIFMSAALCDVGGRIDNAPPGRLKSRELENASMSLFPLPKVLPTIRKQRKDIFLVGFKTTAGDTPDEQFDAGLRLMKESSCNLVLANDIETRVNMIITPEQARYAQGLDRTAALRTLAFMAVERSKGTFTRSEVKEGSLVPWEAEEVPENLRTVVEYCIAKGAYAPFDGKTVGHFAAKVTDGVYLTSVRKSNFNTDLREKGMVCVYAQGNDRVLAYGARPSVGGQSQRIIFQEHPELDCIVHFHCPIRPGREGDVSVRSQLMHECGSHQCGKNTSDGLRPVEDGVKAVMLDNHGPNIVFRKDVPASTVISFIERNFDLSRSTRGYAHPAQ